MFYSVSVENPPHARRSIEWPGLRLAAALFTSFVFLSDCLIINVLCFGAARVGETEADMINSLKGHKKKLERRAGSSAGMEQIRAVLRPDATATTGPVCQLWLEGYFSPLLKFISISSAVDR